MRETVFVADYRDFRLEGRDRLHLGQVTRNGVLIYVDDVFSSVVLLLRRLPRPPHPQLTISTLNKTFPPMNPSATWLLAVVQNRVYFSYFFFVVFLLLFT